MVWPPKAVGPPSAATPSSIREIFPPPRTNEQEIELIRKECLPPNVAVMPVPVGGCLPLPCGRGSVSVLRCRKHGFMFICDCESGTTIAST